MHQSLNALDGETDEWLQTVENGIVTACSRTGGKGGWQLYSISRWTEEDGKKLKRHLEIEFEQKKNRQIYWDDVAMFCYPEEYQLGIRPMNKDDIIEVDNLSELIALDASYKKICGGKVNEYEKRTRENRLDDNTGAVGNRNCIMCSFLFCTRTI